MVDTEVKPVTPRTLDVAAGMGRTLAADAGIPYVMLTDVEPEHSAIAIVPENIARRHTALPLRQENGRLLIAMEEEGVAVAEAPKLDVFFVIRDVADRRKVAAMLAEVRRRGVSADMDYAGRTKKGQDKLVQRLRPHKVVIVGANDAIIETWGEPFADYPVALDDVVDKVT